MGGHERSRLFLHEAFRTGLRLPLLDDVLGRLGDAPTLPHGRRTRAGLRALRLLNRGPKPGLTTANTNCESLPNPISATYRLQFNKDFTFRHATDLLDYLSTLGITHIYASPILSSRRGSMHGYDVIDPTRLNPELGTEADFQSLQEQLRALGMGLVLDIVESHVRQQ